MLDIEQLLSTNAKANSEREKIADALDALKKLREMGVRSEEYDLAPAFGGTKVPSGNDGRSSVPRMAYAR